MSENLPLNEQPQSAQPSTRASGGVWGGIVLIGLGAIFLLQQFGLLDFNFNWWALFILIPAGIMLYNAYNSYTAAGETFDRHTRNQLMGGLILLTVAVIFLADLDWGKLWPVFLIIAGIGVMLNNMKLR